MEFKVSISEEESVKILIQIFNQAGVKYRLKKPNEEGGFFYTDKNGKRKKFKGNIFVKRSIAQELKKRKG